MIGSEQFVINLHTFRVVPANSVAAISHRSAVCIFCKNNTNKKTFSIKNRHKIFVGNMHSKGDIIDLGYYISLQSLMNSFSCNLNSHPQADLTLSSSQCPGFLILPKSFLILSITSSRTRVKYCIWWFSDELMTTYQHQGSQLRVAI